jgi:hypothetical protein
MTSRQLSRTEVLALPPVISLTTLARALGVSEPVVRAACSSGELDRLGIRVNRVGAQWRVVTSTVWRYLGLPGDEPETVATEPPEPPLRVVTGDLPAENAFGEYAGVSILHSGTGCPTAPAPAQLHPGPGQFQCLNYPGL